MARNINKFPEELVRLVLRHLKSEAAIHGSQAFLDALTVCGRWRRIGEQLLYTDVALDPPQLIKFTTSSPSLHTLTRSLTIYVACINHRKQQRLRSDTFFSSFDPEGQNTITAIESFPRIVNGMTKLESLSLIIPVCVAAESRISEAMERTLPALLSMMPNSVRHLEVDAAGFNHVRPCASRTPHLCHLLRERIASLSNLRLRVCELCGDLFGITGDANATEDEPPKPIVEAMRGTILINAIDYDFDGTTQTAIYSTSGPRMLMPERSVLNLVSEAKSAVANDRLRNVGRLSFFVVKENPAVRNVFSAINEVVVVPNPKVLKFPYRQVGDSGAANPERGFLRYKDRNGSLAEAWGGWCDVMNLAEGEVWIQTIEGHRFPSTYFKQETRFRDSVVKTTSLLSEEQVSRRARGNLFAKEKAEGRKLLVVEEIEGLVGLGCVSCRFTSEEWEKEAVLGNQEEESHDSASVVSEENTIAIASDDEDLVYGDMWSESPESSEVDEEEDPEESYPDMYEDELRRMYLGDRYDYY